MRQAFRYQDVLVAECVKHFDLETNAAKTAIESLDGFRYDMIFQISPLDLS